MPIRHPVWLAKCSRNLFRLSCTLTISPPLARNNTHPISQRALRDAMSPRRARKTRLHDTVEDTATTSTELEEQFGRDLAAIVRELTDADA